MNGLCPKPSNATADANYDHRHIEPRPHDEANGDRYGTGLRSSISSTCSHTWSATITHLRLLTIVAACCLSSPYFYNGKDTEFMDELDRLVQQDIVARRTRFS